MFLHDFCMSKKCSCSSYVFKFYFFIFYMGVVVNKEGILKVLQIFDRRTRHRIGQIKSEPRTSSCADTVQPINMTAANSSE